MATTNYCWWIYISGIQTDSVAKQANSIIDTGINKLNSVKILNNSQLFSLISLYAYKTRFQIFNNKYISALNNLSKAINLLKQSFGKENQYENFRLTSGLYLYAISYVTEKYPIFYPYIAFYPKGDKEKGITLLEECLKSDNVYLKTESTYFLMKIYLDGEKKYKKAEIFSKQLITLYPDNLVFLYHHYLILKQANIKESDQIKNRIIEISKNSKQLNDLQKKHFINQL
ncbi:MAG: hypothetical protein ABIJ97_04950 [Bacteroidota bacterium]